MPQPQTLPDLSLADAAELLDVSLKTVRRRIADGTLPAYRVGKLIRIRREDLDALFVRMALDEAAS
jgi:excisionase family DNA binding protein